MRNMNKKNLEMAKFIVSIGEAVYSAWLGAFAEDRAHSEFLDICPYDHSQLEWRAPAAIRASFEREGGRRSCGTRRHSLIGSTSVSGWQKKNRPRLQARWTDEYGEELDHRQRERRAGWTEERRGEERA
jgi:hypothetical protein